jgi:hypothetical protein
VVATVRNTGGRHCPSANCSSDSIASIDAAVRSAPSRSALFTTNTSANFHDAGLEGLHLISRARHERHDRHVRGADDVDFVLADADGLDDHDIKTSGIEDDGGFGGAVGQSTEMAARGHAADEHARVLGVCLHAHAVTENRAAAVRARRVHADNADRASALAQFGGQPNRPACSCRRLARR